MPLSFKSKMEDSARKKDSRIVLALDLFYEEPKELYSEALEIMEEVHSYICALKANRHLVLPLGLTDGVQKLLERACDLGLLTIMDCKINDIGRTNRVIAERYFKAGFDAVIANPFVGWEDGLQPVFEAAENVNKGVLLLVYMSHKSSWEGYGQAVLDPISGKTKPQYVIFAEKALRWNADGVIVGATYPEKIREVYEILEDEVPIFSPGVGAQGGKIESSLKSGARYLIVGRSITLSREPKKAAKTLRDVANKFLR